MKELIDIWKQEKNITREETISLLAVIFAGIITYYQMPANWLTNPDTVWNSIYFRLGHGGEKINGRLFQIVVDKLRMNMITPVFTTVICVMLIAVTALIVGRIFESSFSVKILTGLVLVFIPCTSSSLTYYYCADSFYLALFCVVFGCYLIKKYPSVLTYIISTGLFTASLYLYQAYICIVFTLALSLFLLAMLDEKQDVKDAFYVFLRFVLTSAAAVFLYIVSFKAVQIILHMEVRTDRGMGFTNLFGDEGIVTLIGQAYVNFYEYLWGDRLLNNQFGDRNLINLFIVVLILVMVLTMAVKNKIWKQPGRAALLFLALLLFPLAVEAITVMSPEVDKYGPTGIIMIPTFALFYILPLVMGSRLADQGKGRFFSPLSCLVIVMFLWNSIVFTNLCINSMKLNLNKTQTAADLMFDKIVEEYGYEKGSRLLVAGSMEDGNFPSLYEWPTQAIKGTSASYGFMWDTYTGNENCWVEFMKQYLGVSFVACGQEEYEELLQDSDYRKMPIFPEDGSVQKFGDTIVVKMSEIELE